MLFHLEYNLIYVTTQLLLRSHNNKTSAHGIVHRVTGVIASFGRRVIKLPTTAEKRTTAQVDF